MSRKPFIAGNWKMNTSRAEAVDLAAAMVEKIGSVDEVDTAVCPPSVYLFVVNEVLGASRIGLGAQNMWYEDNGAYTGEASGSMLVDLGCRYVILGHSERRHIMGETDELVNRKVIKALAGGLDPILCVGELLDQRQAGETMDVVKRHVQVGLKSVGKSEAQRVTIAYEPVWAIGTGVTATPDQAQEIHAMIRSLIGEIYDAELAETMRIQYGGSVKPSNAAELLAQADIDGALVGGASLNADDFAAIIRAGM